MRKLQKRGQELFGISFSMIFAIIIIIAIIVVAFYAISHFLSLSNCTKVLTFYDSLQQEIDKAWASDFYQDIFTAQLPTGMSSSRIKNVCFGKMSVTAPASDDRIIQNDLSRYLSSTNANVFMYPKDKICNEARLKTLNHVTVVDSSGASTFFCVPVDSKGKFTIALRYKQTEGSEVKLSKV